MKARSLAVVAAFFFIGAAKTESHWTQVPAAALEAGAHHTRHAELYGSLAPSDFNLNVLRACDTVQATAPDGGGYFVGVKADPPESPIGYELKLFGKPLLAPPRKTSYCSGSSYTVFIEALNLQFPDAASRLSVDRLEALRMQEPDGGRREDGVKFWGLWNDDGPGCQEGAVQYAHMASEIKPEDARPGDFVNINWTSGVGHSVVFLGWQVDEGGNKCIRYFSSQKGTNGLGDQSSPLSKIRTVKFVRVTAPEKIFTFDPVTPVQRRGVQYDKIEW